MRSKKTHVEILSWGSALFQTTFGAEFQRLVFWAVFLKRENIFLPSCFLEFKGHHVCLCPVFLRPTYSKLWDLFMLVKLSCLETQHFVLWEFLVFIALNGDIYILNHKRMSNLCYLLLANTPKTGLKKCLKWLLLWWGTRENCSDKANFIYNLLSWGSTLSDQTGSLGAFRCRWCLVSDVRIHTGTFTTSTFEADV